MKGWKWVGLAGLAGVTATGVAVARAERRRAAYTADEVRERLHARLATTDDDVPGAAAPEQPAEQRTRQTGRGRSLARRAAATVRRTGHLRAR